MKVRIVFLVLCLGLGCGCASRVKLLTDWKVDAGGAMAGKSCHLPETYLGVPTKYRYCDVARLTVDSATPFNVLADELTRFHTNYVDSVICLGNGRDISLRLGHPENYHPYYLDKYDKGVYFGKVGNSLVQFDPEIVVGERFALFMPYWRKVAHQPGRVDAIPKVDKGQSRWFLLYCDVNTNYGAIEWCFVEAYEKGYDALFVIGIDESSPEG